MPPIFTNHTFDNIGVPANPDNPVYDYNPAFVDLGLGGFLRTRPEWAAWAEDNDGIGNFELDAEAEAAIVAFLGTLTDRRTPGRPTGIVAPSPKP